jgi:hypothetical protein
MNKLFFNKMSALMHCLQLKIYKSINYKVHSDLKKCTNNALLQKKCTVYKVASVQIFFLVVQIFFKNVLV